jgi:putative endonuclease
MSAFVYILRCADGRTYVGSTRGSLENRVAEHNAGTFGGYTASRPVSLVFHQEFERIVDAATTERRLKGWSRAKKEALSRGDFETLRVLARCRSGAAVASQPSTSFSKRVLMVSEVEP